MLIQRAWETWLTVSGFQMATEYRGVILMSNINFVPVFTVEGEILRDSKKTEQSRRK